MIDERKNVSEELDEAAETAPVSDFAPGEHASASAEEGTFAIDEIGQEGAHEAALPAEVPQEELATDRSDPKVEAETASAHSTPSAAHDDAGDNGHSPDAPPASEEAAASEELKKDWYILKVQSNRENSICDGLRRRVKIAGLDEYFGDIIVPTEEVREFKDGKARIVKRKLYPGYIVVHMVINDDTWFLVRETPGIGDFTGAGGKPTPMLPHEVERILRLAGKLERPDAKTGPRPLIPYKVGDKVRIEEGNFQNFEGEVSAIDETNGRVTIMIQIFNRTTPVELEHWQVKLL